MGVPATRLAATGYTMLYDRALARLGERFAARGLAPVLVKGRAIADTYPPDQPRICSDVDLLVDEDESAVVEVLTEAGYAEHVPEGRRFSGHLLGERVFVSEKAKWPPVELHRFLDKLIPRPLDYAAIRERARPSPLPGFRYPVVDDHFLLVVLHASCDLGIPRDRVLDDLSYLLGRGGVDIETARALASAWGLSVALDTWMKRLRDDRGTSLGYEPERERSKLCSLAERASAPLPRGLRNLARMLPWYDHLDLPLRGLLEYAAKRLLDRLDSPR